MNYRLQGKKTYLAALALALVTFVRAIGWIDQNLYEVALGLLGAFGLGSLRASNSKTDDAIKTIERLINDKTPILKG